MLTSNRNPLVKRLRLLHRAKGRREQDSFLLEGTNLVEAACQVGYPLAIACATEHWQDTHPVLWSQLVARVERVETVTDGVLGAIATTQNPDGVVAVGDRQPWQPPANPQDPSGPQVGLMLERLQDPGNLGTILRVAAATGVTGVWTSQDSVDLDHPKVLRASAGQWFRVPLQSVSDLSETVRDQRSRGVRIVSTSPTAACRYWDFDWRSSPTLILLGNEGAGLSPALAGLADHSVNIPQRADVESLNVAMSAALLLYEAQRQDATAV